MKKTIYLVLILLAGLVCLRLGAKQISTAGVGSLPQGVTIQFPIGFSSAYLNVPYSKSVICGGGSNTGFTLVITSALPAGITNTTGTTLAGTPTGAGTSSFNVQCKDSKNVTSSNLPISITVNTLTSILVTSTTGVYTVSVSQTLQMKAAGTWQDSTVFDISTLATWAPTSFDTGGTLGLHTGLFTAGSTTTGSPYSVTAAFDTKTSPGVNVTVTTTAPVISNTSPLTAGMINVPYATVQLVCSGGSGTTTYANPGAGMPPGITLNTANGQISGTGTAAATYTPQFTCTNTGGTSPAKTLNIVVGALTAISVALNPTTITSGSISQATATGTYGTSGTSTFITQSGVGAAPTFVSNCAGGSCYNSTCCMSSTTSSMTVTPSASVPVGDQQFLWVDGDCGPQDTTDMSCQPTQRTSNVPTDPTGDLWKIVGSVNGNGYFGTGFADTAWIYCKVNSTAGVHAITATLNNPSSVGTFMGVFAWQYHGASGSCPPANNSFLPILFSQGISNPSSTLSNATAGNTVVGLYVAGDTTAPTAGAGYTLRFSQGSGTLLPIAVEDKVAAATGSQTVGWTHGVSGFGLWNFALGSVGNGCPWTSSNTGAATIDSNGVILAQPVVTQSTAVLTCTIGAITGTATITVNPAAITSITVSPANATVNQGGTLQFQAFDNLGNNITSTATWTSLNTSIATIAPGGLATGCGSCTGQVTIDASSGGVHGTTTLTVQSVSTTSLLAGAVVTSTGSDCTTGQTISVSVPAGWTMICAQSFSSGNVGPQEAVAGDFSSTQTKGGTQSLHTFVNSDQAGPYYFSNVAGGMLGSFTSIYYSAWEYMDAAAVTNDELFIFKLQKGTGPDQEMVYDRYGQSYNTNNPQLAMVLNTISTGAEQSIYGANNSMSAGSWHQWELKITPNTSGVSNGSFTAYKDGVLVQSVSGANLNGTVSMTDAGIQVGGPYTKQLWTSDGTTGGSCQTFGNGMPFELNGGGASFGAINAVCGPLVPSFNHYWGSIIIMKQ